MKKASRDFNRKFKNKYKQKSLLDNLIPDLIGSGIEKADVIIEAATENLEVKRNIFSEIERKQIHCPPMFQYVKYKNRRNFKKVKGPK